MPQPQLAAELRRADVLVLPSRNDSYAMVVAEALASGTPVIVSEMVGAKDLVTEGTNGLDRARRRRGGAGGPDGLVRRASRRGARPGTGLPPGGGGGHVARVSPEAGGAGAGPRPEPSPPGPLSRPLTPSLPGRGGTRLQTMRILHVVPTYLPAWRHGGPILAVHGLCKALAARGHEVTVLTTNVHGDGTLDVPLEQPVGMDGITVRYFPVRPPRRLYFAPGLGRAARGGHRQN